MRTLSSLAGVRLTQHHCRYALQDAAETMEFVIVRPGGLKSEPPTGKAILTEDPTVCGGIHREDCADLIVKCLFSDAAKNKVNEPLHDCSGPHGREYDKHTIACMKLLNPLGSSFDVWTVKYILLVIIGIPSSCIFQPKAMPGEHFSTVTARASKSAS